MTRPVTVAAIMWYLDGLCGHGEWSDTGGAATRRLPTKFGVCYATVEADEVLFSLEIFNYAFDGRLRVCDPGFLDQLDAALEEFGVLTR